MDENMLKESYIAKLKTLPKDTIKVEIGYPSIFAPSESLLSDFNKLKWEMMEKGNSESEARKKAWKQTNFDERYRKKILSNLKLLHALKKIKELSEIKDVYLYCYCGKSPCPRFILMDLIRRM
jgi:hypothetical protein